MLPSPETQNTSTMSSYKLFTSKKLDMTSSCNTAIFISSQGCVQPALKTTYSPGFLFVDNEDEAMFRCLEVI